MGPQQRLGTVGVIPTMVWRFVLAAYSLQDGYQTLTSVSLGLFRCIAWLVFFSDGVCFFHFKHDTIIICLSICLMIAAGIHTRRHQFSGISCRKKFGAHLQEI